MVTKTGVFDAVGRLDVKAVRAMLDARPALLQARDARDRSLLHVACSAPNGARMAGFLLERGLDIESVSGKDRCTPLFFAVARARDPKLVRFLIARGARPANAPGGGLFAAGWFDDVDSLRLLVRAGAKVDVVVGVTPFLACWHWKKFAAAKFLARCGADVNFRDPKTGQTAYGYAVRKKYDPALVGWLVERGGSI